jgi:hypothetical protein
VKLIDLLEMLRPPAHPGRYPTDYLNIERAHLSCSLGLPTSNRHFPPFPTADGFYHVLLRRQDVSTIAIRSASSTCSLPPINLFGESVVGSKLLVFILHQCCFSFLTTFLSPKASSPRPKLQLRDTIPSENIRFCGLIDFSWSINDKDYCCPGVLDTPKGDVSDPYCCIGAPMPIDSHWTTTQTSCATTVHITDSDYTNEIQVAATYYSVTYTTNIGSSNMTVISTATIGDSPTPGLASTTTSTGGSGPRATAVAVAVGAIAICDAIWYA